MTVTNTVIRNPNVARRDLRARIRSVVEFDATHGPVGTVTVFTVTGRVFIEQLTCFCTTLLGSAGAPTLSFGPVGNTALIIPVIAAALDIDSNEWWAGATPVAGGVSFGKAAAGGPTTAAPNHAISANLILTVGTADITSGVLVFDVWYEPITEDGRLA